MSLVLVSIISILSFCFPNLSCIDSEILHSGLDCPLLYVLIKFRTRMPFTFLLECLEFGSGHPGRSGYCISPAVFFPRTGRQRLQVDRTCFCHFSLLAKTAEFAGRCHRLYLWSAMQHQIHMSKLKECPQVSETVKL